LATADSDVTVTYRGSVPPGRTSREPPGGTVPDTPLRHQVVLAGHLGDEDTVAAGLSSPDGATRAAAIGALSRLGTLDDDTLHAALHDTDARVVRRAIELAAHRVPHGPDHAPVLLPVDVRLTAVADGTDADLAEVAAWALGERWQERSDEPAAGRIVDLLERLTASHPDALVREASVASLGAIGADRSVAVIIAAASDKATVRRRAVIALAPFDGPAVDTALAAARVDRDWQVRQAAEDQLTARVD
jgi:HEAT repeat protein